MESRLNASEVLLLAVIQGVAEFLPISSSGHLVVVSQFLGNGEADAGLNVLLHAGTLGSILVHYRRDLLELLGRQRRLVPLLALGTVPAVVAGLLAKTYAEPVLESPRVAGWMLLVTALLLLVSRRFTAQTADLGQMTAGKSLLIGLAQAVALLPGISRSGSTIVAGLGLGLERRAAATWAFLLAVPAIAGAALLEGIGWWRGGAVGSLSWQTAVLGLLVSFGVGLLALKVVIRVVETGHLHWFALWCGIVGVLALMAV
jgi:undecaprenyl-diphosphatase